MIRIRRVYDDLHPRDRAAIEEVRRILQAQIPGLRTDALADLPSELRDPLSSRFRTILFVAEDGLGAVRGFALLRHAPDLRFCYLDYISAAPGRTGGGVGGALYQRVREEARALGARGLFFESLPDDPDVCRDAAKLRDNAARLRFYERLGARPVANTAYATPVSPSDDCPPYLVLDPLDGEPSLGRDEARRIVRAILERRYAGVCTPQYVDAVVGSFRDDPVRLRAPRYGRGATGARPRGGGGEETGEANAPGAGERAAPAADAATLPLVVSEGHEIHHVRERGYVEAPARVSAILRAIEPTGLFRRVDARSYPERHLTAIHDAGFVRYLKRVCAALPPDRSVYPYVFPIRNAARPPEDLALRAGYYCIDTFTPLHRNAFPAAKAAVDCALTVAEEVLAGAWAGYALVRPPGHHAERRAFGGFCYFGTAAAAAELLSGHGRVALLDVDYHHGNGQQDIFWRRADVFTASIHGHPRFAYPYFSGFADERGEDDGEDANLNRPLPEQVDGPRYRRELDAVLRKVADFKPRFVVVALGLDPARLDPTGTWSLRAADFEANGRLIGELGLPTVVVQEGGYRTRTLGVNARRFFEGLRRGLEEGRRG